MTPRQVLSLWRERWGKAANKDRERSYLQGKLTRWGGTLAHASAWSFPGVTVLTLVGWAIVYLMMVTASFTLGGQVAFSLLFVSTAMFVRRYAGLLVTLLLFCLFTIVSTRYLYWRLTATISLGSGLDFVLSIGLWVAEVYLWLWIALRILQTVWPLTRAPIPLPADPLTWPTVDVFIFAQDQTDSVVRQATQAAQELDWPKSKLKIHILDALARDDLPAIAHALGADYWVAPHPVESQADLINSALPATKGDLILILGGTQTPDKSILQSTVGWFLRDKNLGMLQTPHHFLAPQPSAQSLAVCRASDSPDNVACALLRRTMLVDIGGAVTGQVTSQTHTALQLQAQGYGHGYIGDTEEKTQNRPDLDREAPLQPALFRVDSPFLDRALRWKTRLAALQTTLQFYYPAPRFIFLTAPLASLLAGIPLIQTTPELLGAYILPYLLLTHFTQTRLQGVDRLPAWADIREATLAWYLLLPTTLALVRTELRRSLGAFQVDPQALFDRWTTWSYGLVAFLSLAGLGVGIAHSPMIQGQAMEMADLYLLWSAGNVMQLAALLAVAEETRHIRLQTRLLLQMPAMLRMPSGRTLACVTQNFPQPELSLKLPEPLAIDAGSLIQLSIFRGHREFIFEACVVSQHNDVLSLRIEDAMHKDYLLLGAATLSRGADWPQWLPGRNADQPLPPWVMRPFIAAWTKVLAVISTLDKFVKWSRLSNWIGKRKGKT